MYNVNARSAWQHNQLTQIYLKMAIKTRAVPDLLLGNPARAGFCRICKANPARAGAGFHHIISHQ